MFSMKQKTLLSKYPRRPETDLDRKLVDLRYRERDLDREIIDLEAAGGLISDREVDESIDDEAHALLTGAVQSSAPIKKSARRTVTIVFREREVIRRALEIGQIMSGQERADWVRNAVNDRMAAWRSLVRRRAVAALELQRVNRDTEQFKAALGGMPSLPCNTPPNALLGSAAGSGETKRYVESVLKAGIMTQGEIDKIIGQD
jgi:hypothetical protein